MTQPSNPTKNYLKISLLIVASSFLAYSIYWLISGTIWGFTVTQMVLHTNQISILASMRGTEVTALFVQEYCSVANSFILLLGGIFAFWAAVLFVKEGGRYISKLRAALVLTAIFSLLLIPASVHHLSGVFLGWSMVNVYVGLSYLLQALLIVPPLLMLSQKIRNPQNTASIIKWAAITAPLFVFALWFKYMFLWVDTLSPLNTQQANVMSTVGAVNSLFTLLFAGAFITVGCLRLNKNRAEAKKLLSIGLILVGVFFVIYSTVALFVPIYASFWYLTDFWMLTLPVLGIAVLLYNRKVAKPSPKN